MVQQIHGICSGTGKQDSICSSAEYTKTKGIVFRTACIGHGFGILMSGQEILRCAGQITALFFFGKQNEFLVQKFFYERIQGIGAGSLCMMKNNPLGKKFFQQGIDIRMDADCGGIPDSKAVKDGEDDETVQLF